MSEKMKMLGYKVIFGFINKTQKNKDLWFMDITQSDTKETLSFLLSGAAVAFIEVCEGSLKNLVEDDLKDRLFVFLVKDKEGYDGVLLRYAPYTKGGLKVLEGRLIEAVF